MNRHFTYVTMWGDRIYYMIFTNPFDQYFECVQIGQLNNNICRWRIIPKQHGKERQNPQAIQACTAENKDVLPKRKGMRKRIDGI
jgi:hypothetical protein